MADFRKLKQIKFDTVSIKGEYEYKLKPWPIIFIIGFKIKPTDFSKENSAENEMRRKVASERLGKAPLNRAGESVVPIGWRWDGMRYSFDHNPQQLSFGKASSFQVEFYVEAPGEFQEAADGKKKMETMFKDIAKKFANLKVFQTDEWFELTPSK